LIVAGTTSGGTNLGVHNVGAGTTITATLPLGQYFFRVIAVNNAGQSPESPEASFTIGGAPPGTPGRPTATVVGNTVTISWTPGPGGAPTYYLIHAGSTSGGTELGVHNVGPGTTLTVTLGDGVYYIRIVAVNQFGQSAPSGETSWAIGETEAPGVPGTPTATVTGSTVTIAWTAPGTGGAPTHYLIVAGTFSGGTNLGTHNVGSGLSVTATLGAGTYFIRVIAVNRIGQSAQSGETSFTIVPTLSLQAEPTGVGVLFNTDFRFTASGTFAEGTQFVWQFGDGTSATTSVPTVGHIYSQTGTFNVTVEARAAGGSLTAARQVVVRSLVGRWIGTITGHTGYPPNRPIPITRFELTVSGYSTRYSTRVVLNGVWSDNAGCRESRLGFINQSLDPQPAAIVIFGVESLPCNWGDFYLGGIADAMFNRVDGTCALTGGNDNCRFTMTRQ
jgi:hypothetical protein